MIQKDDWRLMNQEVYLKGKKLFHINYNQKERHDLCEFCMKKFISKKQIGYVKIVLEIFRKCLIGKLLMNRLL